MVTLGKATPQKLPLKLFLLEPKIVLSTGLFSPRPSGEHKNYMNIDVPECDLTTTHCSDAPLHTGFVHIAHVTLSIEPDGNIFS